MLFFFSSRRRHTRFDCDWSSDVCSSDLVARTRGARAVSCHHSQHFVLLCFNRGPRLAFARWHHRSSLCPPPDEQEHWFTAKYGTWSRRGVLALYGRAVGVFASLDDHADERDLGGAVSESEMEMAGHEAVRDRKSVV